MDYPFSESKNPSFHRIYAEQFGFSTSCNNLFPNIIIPQSFQSPKIAYHPGSTKENWNREIQNLIIFCNESRISIIYLFWNISENMQENKDYVIFSVPSDWKSFYPKPINWDPISKYHIGSHVGTSGSLKNTLEFLPPYLPFQVFISSPTNYSMPKITSENSTVNYIIATKQMKIFSHGPYIYNLAKSGLGDKLNKYLTVATGLGMQGVVFHVGKSTDQSISDALKNMKENILSAISPGLCSFILEVPAGQGTELLSNYLDFLHFASEIAAVTNNVSQKHSPFGICIDSQHVFAAGYEPYQYLKYCVEIGAPILLIHYNDSMMSLGSRVDRHSSLGGKIPWFFLEELASLASEKEIPMVTEF